MTACPRCPASPANARSLSGSAGASVSSSRGPPTYTLCPSTSARTPRPFSASKPDATGSDSPRASAACRNARAMKCSESPSTAAASASAAASSSPSATTLPTTPCDPSVSVPVLSKMTMSASRTLSSAVRSRTRMPLRAASVVVMATTSGTASPSAWGQAMTSTVTTRATVSALRPVATVQAIRVRAATARAT